MKISHTLSFAAGVVFLLASTSTADAKLRPDCINRAISKMDGQMKTLEKDLGKNYRSAENKYNRINMGWLEFARYFRGNWVKQCLAAAPGNRDKLNAFLKSRATPVGKKVRVALDESCVAYSRAKLGAKIEKVKKAAAAGKEKVVKKQLQFIDSDVRRYKIITNCKPMKQEIAALKGQGQQFQQQAAAMAGMKILGAAYKSVAKGWNGAQAAFKNKTEAPAYLQGGQGQRDYSSFVQKCVSAAADLESKKVAASTALPNQGVTFGEAAALCKKVNGQLAAFLDKVVQHNAAVNQAWRDDWKNKNVKGSAMKKVFSDRAERIPRVEDMGSKVVWTYRSFTTGALFHECVNYTFDSSGNNVLNQTKRRCE